ncbi:hypothetical protein M902_1329 [Bacteriovorax sp. BAL6_X]|uniref:hypothetical protein n=1 Tax=Bacteriovorax sp. BAL6_X TaxID=1201290 RepID=UPI000385D5AA|nr:hypothetical protein [Bacteriovorax sp. BAL6_X]EPZ50414.1 hypothetical protein M902_1329 [Bacteriovorax sp. BAL6_X]
MKDIFIITSLLFSLVTHANDETCSRVAVINQQEILIDPSSSLKGEGLRYHLEKDKVALSYLNDYQSLQEDIWRPAVMGTIGSGLILSAFLTNPSSNTRRSLIASGTVVLILNYLLTKTIQTSNEELLYKSINEYNKRQEPKIFLKSDDQINTPEVYIEKSWSF